MFVSSVEWENMISGVGSGEMDMDDDDDQGGDHDGHGKILLLPSQDF